MSRTIRQTPQLFDLCNIPIQRKMMKPSSLFLSLLVLGLALLHLSEAQNGPKDFLDPHNAARAQVGVGPLIWDTTLEQYAKNYAALRSNGCQLIHSTGPYGENIYWGKGGGFTAKDAVRSWVDEKFDYNYNSNSCNSGKVCGHYTQVVWKNSVRLGCASVVCANDATAVFITCNYFPRGNFIGQKPY